MTLDNLLNEFGENLLSIGFYDQEGTWFYIWDNHWGYHYSVELNVGYGDTVARVATDNGYIELYI